MSAYHTYDITRGGTTYRVEYHVDEDMGEPWKEHDGHGIVSEWTSRDKHPGEVVIAEDRRSKRFYDVAATLDLAKRDGWGLIQEDAKGLTKKQITAKTVQKDLDYCKGYLNGDWHWTWVMVFPLTEDGDELRSKLETLGGIESTDDSYLAEVAEQLIDEVVANKTDKE